MRTRFGRHDIFRKPGGARAPLLVGALAALVASSCCAGPLVLLGLGFSGAWIGNLAALEPWRPWFIAMALVALGIAWRRIWRSDRECAPEDICALADVRRTYRLTFICVSALVLAAIAFPSLAPFFYQV